MKKLHRKLNKKLIKTKSKNFKSKKIKKIKSKISKIKKRKLNKKRKLKNLKSSKNIEDIASKKKLKIKNLAKEQKAKKRESILNKQLEMKKKTEQQKKIEVNDILKKINDNEKRKKEKKLKSDAKLKKYQEEVLKKKVEDEKKKLEKINAENQINNLKKVEIENTKNKQEAEIKKIDLKTPPKRIGENPEVKKIPKKKTEKKKEKKKKKNKTKVISKEESEKNKKTKIIVGLLENMENEIIEDKQKADEKMGQYKKEAQEIEKSKIEMNIGFDKNLSEVKKDISEKEGALKQAEKSTKAVIDGTKREIKMYEKLKIMLLHLGGENFGMTIDKPVESCSQLYDIALTSKKYESGLYYIKSKSYKHAHLSYCDLNYKNELEGGWTLVRSNMLDTFDKPTTGLKWKEAINTEPKFGKTSISKNLKKFDLYTGLKHWKSLSTYGQFRYDWSPKRKSEVTNRIVCDYVLESKKYILKLQNCKLLKGKVMPGIYEYSNGRPFSAIDKKNDSYKMSCSSIFSKTPFWYGSCWSGSINGGGEFKGHKYFNGAYWHGSERKNGKKNGEGAGYGWFYVR